MDIQKNQHKPYTIKSIRFVNGDRKQMKNRLMFDGYSIKPFSWEKKSFVSDDSSKDWKYDEYKQLRQAFENKGYTYFLRIYSKGNEHTVQAYYTKTKEGIEIEKIGNSVKVDSIAEARATCYKWYFNIAGDERLADEGFIVEEIETHEFKRKPFISEETVRFLWQGLFVAVALFVYALGSILFLDSFRTLEAFGIWLLFTGCLSAGLAIVYKHHSHSKAVIIASMNMSREEVI